MICDRTFTLCWYLSDGQNLNLPTCFRWGHGDAKVMPCLQEYGSSPVPLELSSSPELQYCCFPAMAVPKHFFPMSRITVASVKKLTNKKPMHPKPNQPTNQKKSPKTKPKNLQCQTKNLKHFCISAGSLTGNSNNLPFPRHQCMVKGEGEEKGCSWWELKRSFNFSLK